MEGEIGRQRELLFWGTPASARTRSLSLILKNKEVPWPQLCFLLDVRAEFGKQLGRQVRRARLCPSALWLFVIEASLICPPDRTQSLSLPVTPPQLG